MRPFNVTTDDTMDPNLDYARYLRSRSNPATPVPFYRRAAFWWPWGLMAVVLLAIALIGLFLPPVIIEP